MRGKLPDIIVRLNPYIFCEIHNRFIVNMKHIKKVDFSDNFVTMYNGDKILLDILLIILGEKK